MPAPDALGDSPIEPAVALADLVRTAALPGAPARSGASARRQWDAATDLVRGQAALLLEAEEPAWATDRLVGGEPRDAIRLPRSLALVTLASAHADWLSIDAEQAKGAAAEVLERLAALGYDGEGLALLDALSAVWMFGGGHPVDAAARLIMRGEEHLAAASKDGTALLVGRGLVAAGRRRQQLDRHGLILPAEAKAAIGPLSYSDVTRETGAQASAISVWLAGTRRVADQYALWLLHRLETGATQEELERPRNQGGRKRKT